MYILNIRIFNSVQFIVFILIIIIIKTRYCQYVLIYSCANRRRDTKHDVYSTHSFDNNYNIMYRFVCIYICFFLTGVPVISTQSPSFLFINININLKCDIETFFFFLIEFRTIADIHLYIYTGYAYNNISRLIPVNKTNFVCCYCQSWTSYSIFLVTAEYKLIASTFLFSRGITNYLKKKNKNNFDFSLCYI